MPRPPARATASATKSAAAAADALVALADDSGLTLVQLATAWVAHHPAVSSVVIGPHTMAQLDAYLAADNVDLGGDVLDFINAIVAPGVTLDSADILCVCGTRALDAAQRRR